VVEDGVILFPYPMATVCELLYQGTPTVERWFFVLQNYLTPKVIFTAVLIGLSVGLLFEGFMIGPEYDRTKPLPLIIMVLIIEGAFVGWLWLQKKGNDRTLIPCFYDPSSLTLTGNVKKRARDETG